MSEDFTEIKKMMTRKMMEAYCTDVHGAEGLCPECTEWMERACRHLDACRHKEKGWPCNTCPDCCFGAADRQRIEVIQAHMVR